MDKCIWALLTVGQLEFINSSSYDKLKGHSLFDLIHPDEVLLAKRDLYKFMNSNLLGGSVTRCRLKDYTNNNNFVSTPLWIIVDIIMYVATDDLVLAFFHRQPQQQDGSICGDYNFCSSSSKKNSLFQQLRSSSPTLSTSSSSCSFATAEPYYPPFNNNAAYSSPHQFFHILDNRTKSVLLSWPDHYPNEMGGAQMDLLDDRPMSPGISCFHCVQKPTRTTPSGQKVHSFIIEYGSISFVLINIEKSKLTLSSSTPSSLSLPSSPVYSSSKRNVTVDQSPFSLSDEQQLQHYHARPSSKYNTHHNNSPYGSPARRTSAPSSPIRRHRASSITTSSNKHSSAIKLENLLLPSSNNSNKQQPQQQQLLRNRCQSCGTESSPEWRRGPTGHKTLCNACGLRYSRSVARQSKIANQQKHSLFQSQNTPHHQQRQSSPQSPSSSCSSLSSFNHSLSLLNMDTRHHQQQHIFHHPQSEIMSPYYNNTNNTVNSAVNVTNHHRHQKHHIGYAVLS